MTPFLTIRPLLGTTLLGLAVPAALATQAPVTLTGWAGRAALAANPGPGETLFLLRAAARWSPDAPRERGRYATQVTLPGGRVDRRALRPGEGPGSPRLTFSIPADAVRNLPPDAVRVEAAVVDASTGALLGTPLVARIDQFPTPAVPGPRQPSGPFGWGRPLDSAAEGAQPLTNSGPDGWRFVRVASTPDRPGFFIATTEATNRQVAERLQSHDPNAGRSDEFMLDGPEQPAINLIPEQAEAYLAALRVADPAGVPYRLPTRAEWDHAARAGRPTAYWWGDEPGAPEAANFLGSEPGEKADTTVPGGGADRRYTPNPWGLWHTFGNVAEWATAGAGGSGFARMGGHFRSEPSEALDPPVVGSALDLGPDPFVGLRPAFDLDAEAGVAMIRERLAGDPRLSGVTVAFDPDRATATLTGMVAEPIDRRRAGDLLRPLWFLAAVVDELETPMIARGRLASLGQPTGPPAPEAVLDRNLVQVPVSATWDAPLPVAGSAWWVNVYSPSGGHWAHRLAPRDLGRPAVLVSVPVAMLGPDRSARVALSLGLPAPSPADPRVVSDLATLSLAP